MKRIAAPIFGFGVALAALGAQAAELPVKARKVEYVRICDGYGSGYYYIPGTDTCIKIAGGYLRSEHYWNAAGGGSPNYTGPAGHQTRGDTNDYATRMRGNVRVDTRTSTPYGVLRTYESIDFTNENQGTVNITLQNAFIQWAGFTFGRAQSFVDIFFLDPYQYATPYIGSSTFVNGPNLAAYTWELGGGFTHTAFIEERRSAGLGRPVANLSLANAITVGNQATSSSNGEMFPDFGGVFRWDRSGNTLGVFAVGHDASATYYATQGVACPGSAISVPVTTCGHPPSALGWAAGAGGTMKVSTGPGDLIGAQFVWSQGAATYAANLHNSAGLFGGGNQVAVGWLTDGVFVTGSRIELTAAWSVVAAYDHFWTPQFKTSLHGGYLHVDYNAAATRYFCVTGTAAVIQTNFNTMSNCNPDYNVWVVGTRTEWSPVANFTLGVDVYFTYIDTGFAGTANLGGGIGERPVGIYQIKNEGITAAIFRVQRTY